MKSNSKELFSTPEGYLTEMIRASMIKCLISRATPEISRAT
jgi:hypothetical protein